MNAHIHETNAGFPGVGDYVIAEGALYRVVAIGGDIHTPPRRYTGNYVEAQLELADWCDCLEGEEYPCDVRTQESE